MINFFKKYAKLFGIILFLYILSRINLSDLFQISKEVKFHYFSLGIALLLLSAIIRIFRWRILINSIGVDIPLKMISTFIFKSVFLGIITPGRVGDFWRAKYLAESTPVSLGKAFYTAVIDKFITFLIIMLIGIIGTVILFWFLKIEMMNLIIFAGISAAFIIFFLVKKEVVEKIFKFFLRALIPDSQKDRTRFFFEEFYQGLKTLKISLVSKLLVLVTLDYFIGALIYYFAALSLGLYLPFWYIFLIIGLVWISIFLPITVFGLGTREGSLIFFFSFFGLAPTQAVAFSLLILLYDVTLAIPGLILFLTQKQNL
ncbi:MAG: lysylphosphatidylglycerol synthase transmembrane domain-containing protein [Patescibacteria group bacterium]|nr:lysylphosphatidylglycerol synthase transmembrane domain-containing protein [Patescibacteria group bacterium]